jgi:predicted permease
MGKKRKIEKNESSAVKEGLDWLLAERNRGTLLDVVVFVLNLFLMRLLVGYFLDVASLASNGDAIAQAAMFLFCVSLFVLPPAGAVMKRWHFHKRRGGNQPKESALSGCLFNPIFYFCLTAVIFSAVNAFILQFFASGGEPEAGVFISSIFIGIGLMITHSWLVYRYFTPPKTEPRSEFLRSPASELAGDICIFVNMINFQIIWNLLSFSGLPHPTGPFDVIARIFVLCFIALLIYFPPRMFYLAEDIDKGRTWLMILLANAPVIIRVVIGTGDASDWQ